MLPIKSKFKIAKRLGAGIFEQTQTQKFALSEARVKRTRRRSRGGSDYGRQLLEKQRVRFTYGLSERQLSNYAKQAYTAPDPAQTLHILLETRADSLVYRAGIAPTRRAARQIVSHGHFMVNGRRTTTPSYHLKIGDVLAIREGSRKSPLFTRFGEDSDETPRATPQWLTFDPSLMKVEIVRMPTYNIVETLLDYATVFEFYSR